MDSLQFSDTEWNINAGVHVLHRNTFKKGVIACKHDVH